MNSKASDNSPNDRLFRVLIQNSPVGVILIQDNKVVYQNAKSQELIDARLGMSINKAFHQVYDEDLFKVRNAFKRILSKSFDSMELEFRVNSSNHKEKKPLRWIRLFARTFKNKGRFSVLINFVDYSKSKKSAELANLIDRMSFFDQIAAGVAHEIRNPLTAISSYLYSMEKIVEQDLEEQEHLQSIKAIIDQIDAASSNIESVIRNLMVTARIGSPKMVLMNANESIEEIIDFMRDIFRQNGIAIIKLLEAELPSCYADPVMIKQAIMNLVSNACYALEKNFNPKKIEFQSFFKENMIFISISDSGKGIPEKIKERLSKPLSPSMFTDAGIGIRVIQKIIALHSGSFQAADSRWGGGKLIIGLPVNKRAVPRE